MAATPFRAVRVNADLWAAAKAEAETRGETVTDAINRALVRYTKPRTTTGKDTHR